MRTLLLLLLLCAPAYAQFNITNISRSASADADVELYDANWLIIDDDDDDDSDPVDTQNPPFYTVPGTAEAVAGPIAVTTPNQDNNAKATVTISSKIANFGCESKYKFELDADTKDVGIKAYATARASTQCFQNLKYISNNDNDVIVHYRATLGFTNPPMNQVFKQGVIGRCKLGPYNLCEVKYKKVGAVHYWHFQGYKLPSSGMGPAEPINVGVYANGYAFKHYNFYMRVDRNDVFDVVGDFRFDNRSLSVVTVDPAVDVSGDWEGHAKMEFMGIITIPGQ